MPEDWADLKISHGRRVPFYKLRAPDLFGLRACVAFAVDSSLDTIEKCEDSHHQNIIK